MVGRYTQSDPIGVDGGLNTFSYVGQSPLNYIDPKGLMGGKLWKEDAKEIHRRRENRNKIKSCMCDADPDDRSCYGCCTAIIKFRPSASSVGFCESMCFGEIMKGHDVPIPQPSCDDEHACVDNQGNPNA